MCLVVFAWQAHPQYRLILAGNRDESHHRPTQDAHWWPDNESILAGRDLQAGGTWLAMSKSGRFATVTNFHERQGRRAMFESRGTLVTDFVAGSQSLGEFESSISNTDYAGFSLLVCDGESMFYLSNRDDMEAYVAPGIYGLSNASLDTPWSKVVRAKACLESLIENDAVNDTELLRLLSDRTPAAADDIAADDLPFEIGAPLRSCRAHNGRLPFQVRPRVIRFGKFPRLR
jgi:uncharacterized protein with NRDE domain